MKKTLSPMLICSIFIGTIVGAGFASGQEILQFFARFGWWGVAASAAVGILFAMVARRLMQRGKRFKGPEALAAYYMGEKGRKIVSICLFICTVMTMGAMFAGVEALCLTNQDLMPLPNVLVTAGIAVLVVSYGMKGLAVANGILVPCIAIFFTFASLIGILQSNRPLSTDFQPGILISPILYVSLNIVLSAVVLMDMGKIAEEKAIFKGARWSGWILFVWIGLLTMAIGIQSEKVKNSSMPALGMMSTWGEGARLVYGVMVYFSILTTLLSAVYFLSHRFRAPMKLPYKAALVTLLGMLIGKINFADFVKYIYPVMGILGLGFVLLAFWPEPKGQLSRQKSNSLTSHISRLNHLSKVP